MVKKLSILLMVITLLLAGCSSGLADESSKTTQESQPRKFFNASTSQFDSYTNEQTDTAYIITGTVSQENDGNAILVHIHAEKDLSIGVTGTIERVSGGDTQLVYVAPDGTETKIADNSVEKVDNTINILAGESKVKFLGESAVYDFDIRFGLSEGVSYSDL